MRIVQVTAHSSPVATPGGRTTGGMNVYVLELSRALARLGHEVDLIARREGGGPAVEPLAENLRLVRIDAGPAKPLAKEEVIARLPEFSRVLERFLADGPAPGIIHGHYWQGAWAAGVAARRLALPHVVMFHTLGEVKNRARITEEEPHQRIHHERNIARRADAIMVASSHEEHLLERYYGAPAAGVHVVPCGVDTSLFSPGDRRAAREATGLPLDGPIALWVGRLEKLKGVDILVDAVAQVGRPDLRLVIVGGDEGAQDLKDELRHQAEAAGIGNSLHFTGAVPHEALPLYYRAADVVVVPSYYESFGLVAVEAMACGTPVVASRVGGLVSTVSDGISGYLIPWRCPEPFAEKIGVLVENDELRANFGRSARKAAERYAWPRVAAETGRFYEHVVEEHWRTRPASAPRPFANEAFEAAVLAAANG